MPHYVIPVTAVVAIAIGLAVYFSAGTGKNYATTPVVLGTVSSTLSTSGTVKSATQTNLAFPKSGRVASVSVKAGDTVYKGQTLAALDSSDAQGAVETAKGAYQSALANSERLKNGASSVDLSIAKITYNNTVSETAMAVETAYQKLLSTDLVAISNNSTGAPSPLISGTYTKGSEGIISLSIYGAGNGNYWNASGVAVGNGAVNTSTPQPIGDSGLYVLFPSTNISGGTAFSITIPNITGPNYTADNAAYQTALQNQTNKVAAAQAALNKITAAPRSEDIAQAEAQVSSAQGALHTAEAALANDFITAPIITSIDDTLSPGGIVTSNTPLIGIMSKGSFQIESYVSEKDLSLVVPGANVNIVTDAYGPSVVFAGTIEAVNPAATMQTNGQLGYKVTYVFTKSDSRIKPGISANITVVGNTKSNVLVVPRTAIFLKNGASFVLVRNGSKTAERPVTIGLSGSDTSEIVSGLTAGELVVTLGNN